MNIERFAGVRLGELFRHSKDKGFDGLPTLAVTLSGGVVRRNTLARKMETNLEPHEHLLVRKGDIAYNMMRMWQGASGMAKEDGLVSPAYVVCSPKKNVCPEYFAQLFRTPLLIKRFQDYAYGITGDRLRLYFKDFGKIHVKIPPYVEQCEIARILSVVDNAISLTENLIVSKGELRKGLMQQLLSGKRRIRGFNKSWQEVRLGEVFSNRIESGRTDLPLISITGNGGVVFSGSLDRKDSSSKDKSKYLRICPGDIGYNTMRMWQGFSGLSRIEGIVSPAYTIVTPDDSLDPEFMALLFKYPPIVYLFYRYSQGLVSDTWNLKFRHFSEIRVRLPEKKEQEAIAAVFRPVDKELSLLRQQLDAFKEQKKGLMQQLLTGKVRVKPVKEAVA